MPSDSPLPQPNVTQAPVRLSIAHLMLLMLACSLTFTILTLTFPKLGSGEGTIFHPEKHVLLRIANAFATGLALGGALCILLAVARRQIRCLLPGHGLLLVAGIFWLAGMIVQIPSQPDGRITDLRVITANGVLNLAESLGFVLLAWTWRRRPLWCALALGMTLQDVWLGLFWFEFASPDGIFPELVSTPLNRVVMHPLFYWTFGLLMLLTAAAWSADRLANRPTDWLHHLGAAVFLVLLLLNLLGFMQ